MHSLHALHMAGQTEYTFPQGSAGLQTGPYIHATTYMCML